MKYKVEIIMFCNLIYVIALRPMGLLLKCVIELYAPLKRRYPHSI